MKTTEIHILPCCSIATRQCQVFPTRQLNEQNTTRQAANCQHHLAGNDRAATTTTRGMASTTELLLRPPQKRDSQAQPERSGQHPSRKSVRKGNSYSDTSRRAATLIQRHSRWQRAALQSIPPNAHTQTQHWQWCEQQYHSTTARRSYQTAAATMKCHSDQQPNDYFQGNNSKETQETCRICVWIMGQNNPQTPMKGRVKVYPWPRLVSTA